ncbi:MAG TPA: Ig-like domain-containing protein [Candidatus Saccharimonadales bacterium]
MQNAVQTIIGGRTLPKRPAFSKSVLVAFGAVFAVAGVVLLIRSFAAAAPVGYWQFNEGSGTTAADSSSSGYNGTLLNGPTWVSGKIGSGALNFDGVDDRVEMGDVLDAGTDNLSVSVWVKPTSSAGGRKVIEKAGSANYALEDIGSNNYRFRISDGTNSQAPQFFVNLSDGQWHHVVVVLDRVNNVVAKFYVDGLEEPCSGGCGNNLKSIGDLQSTNSFNVGTDWQGGIDDLRVYRQALNLSDIQALYALGGTPAASITPIVDDHSITMMSRSLDIGGQAGWGFYNGGDAPEGAYLGWLTTNDSLDAVVHLPKMIDPGRYYLFFKGISYDTPLNVSASFGASTSTATVTNDRDENKYWTTRSTLDIFLPTDTITLKIEKTQNFAATQKYLFRGLYLTSDSNETVTRDDIAVDLNYPTQMDESPPTPGNYIYDGSFETGIHASWGFAANKATPIYNSWDATQAHSGTASFKMSLDTSSNFYGSTSGPITSLYRLKPNKRYTVSAWVKTSGETTAVSIGLYNPFIPPSGYGYQPRHAFANSVTANGNWQRVTATGYALKYPTSDYRIYINANSVSNANLWIDDVQLEEGSLTDFASASPLEAGLQSSMTSHLYYEDEPLNADLRVRNHSASSSNGVLNYEIYDFMNRLVKNGTVNVSAAAQSTTNVPFSLFTGKSGAFRLVYWINDQSDRLAQEFVYSIIPRPSSGSAEASYIGIHPNYLTDQLTVLKKMGINWARVLSPSAFFRWSVVEPVDDQITWYDAEMQRAAAAGIQTMGTIGTNNFWPAWADNGGLPNLDEWQEFVGQITAHYKPWVKYWEIWNEPNSVFSADFYAQMLKRAADAIEANDPDAKIVGMGGTSLSFMNSVIASLQNQYPTWDWRAHLDVLSTHDYPGGTAPEPFKSGIIDQYSVPVWNTETGAWDKGFYLGPESDFLAPGKSLWPNSDAQRYYHGAIGAPQNVIDNFVRTIGSGQTKYFYYDSRLGAAAHDYPLSHPTIFEHDRTIRTKGVAYAVAGSLLDHSAALGDVAPKTYLAGANTYAHLFDKGGQPIAVLWTKDHQPQSVSLSLSPSQFSVYDLMGNVLSVTSSTVQYGRLPIYIKGNGTSVATMKTALESGTYSSRSDSQPPNLSITESTPRHKNESNLYFRWIAVDDSSFPNLGEVAPEQTQAAEVPRPEAISYRSRLVGYNDWSNWSGRIYTSLPKQASGTYTFEVQAKDEAGNISETASRSINFDPTPPPPPPADTTPPSVSLTSPAANETVSGTVNVTADATDNVGVTKVEFFVDGSLSNSDTTSPYGFSWDTTTLPNGSHSLIAKAYDAASNNVSTGSLSVNVINGDTTPPSTPTALSATAATYNRVNLSWTTSTDNIGISGYYIVRNGVTIALSTGTATTYSDSTVAASTSYSYQVMATDAVGNTSGLSNAALVTTPQAPDTSPPTAPSDLTATAVSSSQINLSWTTSTDNIGITGYDIYRNGAKIATVTTTTFGNAGLSPSTSYSYYVIAKDAAGNQSAQSNTASATTSAPVTTGILTGVVSSSAGGAIAYGKVSTIVNGSRVTVITTSAGSYSIVNMLPATYSVRYSAHRHKTVTKSASISSGVTTTLNVTLQKR